MNDIKFIWPASFSTKLNGSETKAAVRTSSKISNYATTHNHVT
jgi:hypothetical protein